MTQELVNKFVLSARGTFLEEDRNSNFPNENTLLMTDNNHPITPTPALIRKWNEEAATAPMADQRYIATQAARWGADQELEWCVNYVDNHFSGNKARALRAARRPKPPSLKEQALQALENADGADHPVVATVLTADQHALIRKALEQLDD